MSLLVADAEAFTQLYQACVTIITPHRYHAPLLMDLDTVQGVIHNLDREDGTLLLVQEIPDIQDTILLGDKEHRWAGGAPATIRQVLSVRAGWHGMSVQLMMAFASPGPHDGAFLDVLGPDPGTPVTNCQKVLKLLSV